MSVGNCKGKVRLALLFKGIFLHPRSPLEGCIDGMLLPQGISVSICVTDLEFFYPFPIRVRYCQEREKEREVHQQQRKAKHTSRPTRSHNSIIDTPHANAAAAFQSTLTLHPVATNHNPVLNHVNSCLAVVTYAAE